MKYETEDAIAEDDLDKVDNWQRATNTVEIAGDGKLSPSLALP